MFFLSLLVRLCQHGEERIVPLVRRLTHGSLIR